MCYSAKVKQNLRDLERQFGTRPDYQQIIDLFHRRLSEPKIQISRAFEDNFTQPRNDHERQTKALIIERRAKLETDLMHEMFAQLKRKADAGQSYLPVQLRAYHPP
jgi:hypothetical protein